MAEKATKSYKMNINGSEEPSILATLKKILARMGLDPSYALDSAFYRGFGFKNFTEEEIANYQFSDEETKVIEGAPAEKQQALKQAFAEKSNPVSVDYKRALDILRWPQNSSNPYYKGDEKTFETTYGAARELLVSYVKDHGIEGIAKLPGRIVVASQEIIKTQLAEQIGQKSKESQSRIDEIREKLFDTPQKNEDGSPVLDGNGNPVVKEGLQTQYTKAYNELLRLQAEKASHNLPVDRELTIDKEIQEASDKVAGLKGQISGIVQDIKKLEENVVEEGKEQSVAEKRLKGVFKQATKEKKAEERVTLRERITGLIQKFKQQREFNKMNREINSVAPVVKAPEPQQEETVEKTDTVEETPANNNLDVLKDAAKGQEVQPEGETQSTGENVQPGNTVVEEQGGQQPQGETQGVEEPEEQPKEPVETTDDPNKQKTDANAPSTDFTGDGQGLDG